MTNCVHHFLEQSATQYPDKTAVVHAEERISYAVLNQAADNLAVYLITNGIGKGDRIALLMENSVDYVIAYYGSLKAGAVAAPLNPGLKPDGLQYYNIQIRTITERSFSERPGHALPHHKSPQKGLVRVCLPRICI